MSTGAHPPHRERHGAGGPPAPNGSPPTSGPIGSSPPGPARPGSSWPGSTRPASSSPGSSWPGVSWPAERPGARPGEAPATPSPPLSAPSGSGAPSRVSILAPRTRIDVALPPDVPVADLLAMLLDLAGETGRDGDGTASAWTLAPLGAAPAEPHHTLASLGVLDGDQLVLRRRADAAPAPLFDDVVDAVAEATPASFRAWGPTWATRLGVTGLGVGLALATAALLAAGRGPGTADGVVTAVVAGVLAMASVLIGVVAARAFDAPAAGAVAAGGAVALAAVCGLAAVPGPPTTSLLADVSAPHLLLAAVLAVVTAGCSLLVLGITSRAGVAALVASLTAAGLVAVVAGVVTAIDAHGDGLGAAAAAGAGATAMIALSLLPRTSIALARLPLPQVPGTAEELADDPGVVEQAVLDRRTDRAHAVMNGLVLGCGVTTAGAAAALALVPVPGLRGIAGWVLAGLLVVLLALRSRTYANGVQAASLVCCALAGVLGVGVGTIAATRGASSTGALAVALVVPVLALAVGGVALLLGTVVPGRRFSPVARRAVDLGEAVGIAAVVPVALAVMNLYSVVRLL